MTPMPTRLIEEPCAYCGTTAVERTVGHVVPRNIYRANGDSREQLITVPECRNCMASWEGADGAFRDMMVISGEPNQPVQDLWDGTVARSLTRPAGRQWARDIVNRTVAREVNGEVRHLVFPGQDPKVMHVVRRIVRGLCHYERISTAVPDGKVWAQVMDYEVPEEYQAQMTWRRPGSKIFRYGFIVMNDTAANIHSFWLLTIFERRVFHGIVALTEGPEFPAGVPE